VPALSCAKIARVREIVGIATMNDLEAALASWTRNGRPAYPTPAEVLYLLLRLHSEEAVEARFRHWRLTERESRSLLALRPLARELDIPSFERRLEKAVCACAADFPPILRPGERAAGSSTRRKEFAALLRGKNVALVGPSESTVGSGQGERIESRDLVVRMNFQWPVPPALQPDIGKRMDVLYHCCSGDIPIEGLFRDGFEATRFVCWQQGIASFELKTYCEREGVPHLDVSAVYSELLDSMQAFPSTGAAAIHHLLQQEIEELYVTGVSFFHDPYYAGYRGAGVAVLAARSEGPPDDVGIHRVAPQLAWFRKVAARDRRVRVDERLRRILVESEG
jgi:hypothetical protein